MKSEGKAFFFEKKKQKTFVSASRTKLIKVFCFFFSKKNCLLSYSAKHGGCSPIPRHRVVNETRANSAKDRAPVLRMMAAR